MHRRKFLKTVASCLGAVDFANVTVNIFAADTGSPASDRDSKICLNQLGFLPDGPKLATVGGRANSFLVRSMKNQSVAFRSPLSPPSLDHASGDTLQLADFSALPTPGEYRIELDSGVSSNSFPIRPDAHDHALLLAMRSFYGQRCGYDVDLGGGYSDHIVGSKFVLRHDKRAKIVPGLFLPDTAIAILEGEHPLQIPLDLG
jgi:hypothetical protein